VQIKNGNTKNSEFNVTIGREYIVFAINIWHESLNIFISADYNLSGWYPIELFTVSDPKLPSDWFFFSSPTDDVLQALWGYETLVKDMIKKGTSPPPTHYDDLLDRDSNALMIFEKQKIKYEAIESTKNELDNNKKKESYLLCNYGLTLEELKDIVEKVGSTLDITP
jgi:hypothetical protein